jgi:hypothetical protein
MATYKTPRFIREPQEAYHAQREYFLTSHQVIDFKRCPLAYKLKKSGLMARRDSEAFTLGRAAHTLILEGSERFDVEYAVGDGPINPKTGNPYGSETKTFAEWARTQGRPTLPTDQYDLLCRLQHAVQEHNDARRLLSQGIAEGVLRCTYVGLPCQVRLDWFSPSEGLVDLKTCNDLDEFEADSRLYHYIDQMAFYQAVLCEVTDELVPVHLIGVEKREPHRCGVWLLDADDLYDATLDNEDEMRKLALCQAANEWPTGYEQTRILRATA